MMNVSQYLTRIAYQGELSPNLDVLNALQKHHLLRVPFENLDIHSDTPIILDSQRIYQKIVGSYRGGFCYELNGLFHDLLLELGFEARRISGRVYDEKSARYGKEYDHLAIIVQLDSQIYLVDVGFGEFAFHPLKLVLAEKQMDERGVFFIDQFEAYYRVNKLKEGKAVPQYLFKTQPRAYEEFTAMSHHHQTSEATHFTKKKFLGIPIINGRITLVGNKLKRIRKGDVVEERIIEEEEYASLLVKHFYFRADL
ncbi:MAG: arylamine N-acetyltransferase [Bacteroidota bacterium]